MLIFVTFMVLAHGTFGGNNPQFASLGDAWRTQLVLVTSGLDPKTMSEASTLFIIYTLLFYIIMGMLPRRDHTMHAPPPHRTAFTHAIMLTRVVTGMFMLNFFLAIVLDSYAKVQKDVQAQVTDLSIWQDLYFAGRAVFLGWRHKWPSGSQQICELRHIGSEQVSAAQLTDALFKGDAAAANVYLQCYLSFDQVSTEPGAGMLLPSLLTRLPLVAFGRLQASPEHPLTGPAKPPVEDMGSALVKLTQLVESMKQEQAAERAKQVAERAKLEDALARLSSSLRDPSLSVGSNRSEPVARA